MVESLLESREAEIVETNQRFYDRLWADARLVTPDRFNTWPLVQPLVASARQRFEVAPGLRPRLPIAGTHFLDISGFALRALHERGGIVTAGRITALPYPDAAFELLCALDIVEHVEDDDGALSELARVTTDGGTILLSLPLHPTRWTAFDDFVGHRRRYEPEQLLAKLARHGLTAERSAAYGMQPRSSRLLDVGMWWLTHRRERAMWVYNRILMPLALRFQKKLALVPGMIRTENVDEILLVCRKTPSCHR
jgi:SAM-dependent methyltransferase